MDLGAACYLAYMQTLGARPGSVRWLGIEEYEREAWRAAADMVRMLVQMRDRDGDGGTSAQAWATAEALQRLVVRIGEAQAAIDGQAEYVQLWLDPSTVMLLRGLLGSALGG